MGRRVINGVGNIRLPRRVARDRFYHSETQMRPGIFGPGEFECTNLEVNNKGPLGETPGAGHQVHRIFPILPQFSDFSLSPILTMNPVFKRSLSNLQTTLRKALTPKLQVTKLTAGPITGGGASAHQMVDQNKPVTETTPPFN